MCDHGTNSRIVFVVVTKRLTAFEKAFHHRRVPTGGGIGLDGAEAVAVRPHAADFDLWGALSEDVHALGRLTAEHVLNGRQGP